MTARRAVAASLLAGLVLAACRSGSPPVEPTAVAPAESPAAESPAAEMPAAETPADGSDAGARSTAADGEPTAGPAGEPTDELPPTTTLADSAGQAAAGAPTESTAEGSTEGEPGSAEPTTAVSTTSLPSEPDPAIVDECSTDGSPTPLEVADGPVPELAVTAASAGSAGSPSPLPDLAVRRINCGGGWVQLRNEIPADRPLLIWFWAPH